MKKLILFISLLMAATVYAQSSASSNLSPDLAVPPTTNTSEGTATDAATSSEILKHVIAGWKSQNSSGRNYDLKNNGRQVQAQQEVWLGYKHASGWGLYGLYANTYTSFPHTAKWTMGDPSATLVHPAWYVGDSLRISGKLRQYFPESTYSQDHGMRQTAYYLDTIYQMAHRQEIYNNTTFRFFTYENHGPTATRNYVEDTTNYTKYFSKNFRWGIGHWSQYETHYQTPAGYCVELTPLLDYAPNHQLIIGPRLRLPVLAHGSVYDGPTSASWNQAYFQLFLLANL
jgi:hypothetical protein